MRARHGYIDCFTKNQKTMKKLLTVAAFILAAAWATPAAAQGFSWGVVGGLNLSKVSFKGDNWKNALSSDNRAGWYIGPKVAFSLPLGLSFDGSVQYSQRKLNIDAAQYEGSTKTLSTIEIPINVRYSIGLGKMASVYVSTGPQFGFNVSGREWNIFSSNYNQSNGMFKNNNMLTTWNVGAGVKVLGHLEVGLGYNFGLGKLGETVLSNVTPGLVGGSDDYKANTFQVQVAYMF